MLYFSGVQVGGESGHGQDEADIAHAVINYCLKGSGISVSTSVPPANKKERYNTHPLSADKKLEYVIC